jgi:hypothetical protein
MGKGSGEEAGKAEPLEIERENSSGVSPSVQSSSRASCHCTFDDGSSSSSSSEDTDDGESEGTLSRSMTISDFSFRVRSRPAIRSSSSSNLQSSRHDHPVASRGIRLKHKDACLLNTNSTKDAAIFHFKAEKLPLKNVSLEIQAREDLLSVCRSEGLGDLLGKDADSPNLAISGLHKLHSKVLINVPETTAEGIVSRFARELVASKLFNLTVNNESGESISLSEDDDRFYHGMKFALSSRLMHANVRIQSKVDKRGKNQALWKCDTLFGRSFIVLSTDFQKAEMTSDLKQFYQSVIQSDTTSTVRSMEMPNQIAEGNSSVSLVAKTNKSQRVVLMAKLRNMTTLSASGHVSKVVVLVLALPRPGNPMPKTASHLSTAHTFATLLTNDDFYLGAVRARSEKQLCQAIVTYVRVLMLKQKVWLKNRKGGGKKSYKNSFKEHAEDDVGESATPLETKIMSVPTTDSPSMQASISLAQLPGVSYCCPIAQHKLGNLRSRKAKNTFRQKESQKIQRAIQRQLKRARESSLVWSGHFLGIINDIRRLSKDYSRGWTDSVYPFTREDCIKLVSGTFWQLFSTTTPAISIGLVYNEITGGAIGVKEMLVSEALTGIVYSLFGGQPCAVLRSTGPLLSYVKILYSWTSANFELEFLAFYMYTGIWLGGFLILFSLTESSVLIKYCGRFTEEILALLVSFVFIFNAVQRLAEEVEVYDMTFVVLFISTFLLSNVVGTFRKSRYITRLLREFISNLAPAISIVVVTAFSYSVPSKSDEIERTPMAADISKPFTTTTGRPWFVDGSGISPSDIFLCFIPGFLVALLFMTEASVGMLLTCRPEMKLRKGSPYLHLDVFLQGVIVVVCSVFGLPWCMVSLPHSPMNVQVLADTEEDDQGNCLILRSRETRLPGLISHLLMLMLVGFASSWIALIPIGAAFGFLLYMGTESLSDNDLFERIQLFFTDPSLYPPHHYVRFVKAGIIHRFTLIQLSCFVFLWLLHDNFYSPALDDLSVPISMFFPVVLLAAIPFRIYVLPRLIPKMDLELLTSVDDHNIAKLFY